VRLLKGPKEKRRRALIKRVVKFSRKRRIRREMPRYLSRLSKKYVVAISSERHGNLKRFCAFSQNKVESPEERTGRTYRAAQRKLRGW